VGVCARLLVVGSMGSDYELKCVYVLLSSAPSVGAVDNLPLVVLCAGSGWESLDQVPRPRSAN